MDVMVGILYVFLDKDKSLKLDSVEARIDLELYCPPKARLFIHNPQVPDLCKFGGIPELELVKGPIGIGEGEYNLLLPDVAHFHIDLAGRIEQTKMAGLLDFLVMPLAALSS